MISGGETDFKARPLGWSFKPSRWRSGCVFLSTPDFTAILNRIGWNFTFCAVQVQRSDLRMGCLKSGSGQSRSWRGGGGGGIIDQKRHLLLFSSQSWAPDRIFQVWGLIVCWHFKFLGIFQKILLAEWLLTKCSVFIQWGPRQSAIYAFWLLGLCVDLRSQSAMCPGDWCLCLGN